MQEPTEIKRSPNGMLIQILIFGAAAVLLLMLAVWLFESLLGNTSGGGGVIQLLTALFILLAWAIASLKLWLDWRVKKYEIAPDALIVHAKAGRFGSTQTVYRYESIVSLRMSQGFFGRQFGYGDVRITIPKIEHEVVLNDIQDPARQVAELQRRMGDRTAYGPVAAGTTAAWVS